nr:MAG TPA: PURINE NUCLEOTIDE SYNTHESIS REPRESSOR/DNA Complex REGULATION, DNA-BINDING, REPRESSOR, PURINE [Caudoviricetes sp.]
MCNVDIRRVAAGNGVRLWQIADALGISDAQFSRKLRREISTEEKEKVFEIIAQLAAEV